MNDLANYSDRLIRLGKPNTKHVDLTADGLDILDDTVSLAEFTAEQARIGKENENHISLTADGMDILEGETSVANFTRDGSRIGEENKGHVETTNSQVSVWDGTNDKAVSAMGVGVCPQEDFKGMASVDVNGVRTSGAVVSESVLGTTGVLSPVIITQAVIDGELAGRGIGMRATKAGLSVGDPSILHLYQADIDIDENGNVSASLGTIQNLRIEVGYGEFALLSDGPIGTTYLRVDMSGNLTYGVM